MRFVIGILLIISAGLALQVWALPPGCQPLNNLSDEPVGLSKILRSNVPHYWQWSKAHGHEHLGKYLDHVGVVVGDAHMANISIVVINKKPHFIVADLDDGGHSPLILDLARHVITTRAVNENIKKSEFLDFYMAGLRNEEKDPPKIVRKNLELSKREVADLQEEYIKKNVKKGKIILDSDELAELQDPPIRREIAKIVSPRELLDVVELSRQTGGNIGAKRYRALVKDGDDLAMLEFKPILEPATQEYSKQLKEIERYKTLTSLFWENTHQGDPNYGVVNIADKTYWMRLKPLTFIDIPYSSQKEKAQKRVEELSLYQAYVLGLLHGRQPAGQKLRKAIEVDPEKALEALKLFTKSYIESLEL